MPLARLTNTAVRFNLLNIIQDTLGSFFSTKQDIKNHVKQYTDEEVQQTRRFTLEQKNTKITLAEIYAGIFKEVYLTSDMSDNFFTDLPTVHEIQYDSDESYKEIKNLDNGARKEYIPIKDFIHQHIINTRMSKEKSVQPMIDTPQLNEKCKEAGETIATMRMNFINVSLSKYQFEITNLLARRDRLEAPNTAPRQKPNQKIPEEIPLEKFNSKNKNVAFETMIVQNDILCKAEITESVRISAISKDVRDKLTSLSKNVSANEDGSIDPGSLLDLIDKKDATIWKTGVLRIFDAKYRTLHSELTEYNSLTDYDTKAAKKTERASSLKENITVPRLKSDLVELTSFMKNKLLPELGGGISGDIKDEVFEIDQLIKELVNVYFDHRESYIQGRLLGLHWLTVLPNNLDSTITGFNDTKKEDYINDIRRSINTALTDSSKAPIAAKKMYQLNLAIKTHKTGDVDSTKFTYDKLDVTPDMKFSIPTFEATSFFKLAKLLISDVIDILSSQYTKDRAKESTQHLTLLNKLHDQAKSTGNKPTNELIAELYDTLREDVGIIVKNKEPGSVYQRGRDEPTYKKYDYQIIEDFTKILKGSTLFDGITEGVINKMIALLFFKITNGAKPALGGDANGSIKTPNSGTGTKRKTQTDSNDAKSIVNAKDKLLIGKPAGSSEKVAMDIQQGLKKRKAIGDVRKSILKSIRGSKTRSVSDKVRLSNYVKNMTDDQIDIVYGKIAQAPIEMVNVIDKISKRHLAK